MFFLGVNNCAANADAAQAAHCKSAVYGVDRGRDAASVATQAFCFSHGKDHLGQHTVSR